MQTFYGNIKFAAGGQNVSKPMVLFQVSCNDDGSKCENKVVAPTNGHLLSWYTQFHLGLKDNT